MTKVIVLSDSHNNKLAIDKLMPRLMEADVVITLGDMLSDYQRLNEKLGDKLHAVKGNCDSVRLPYERVLVIEQLRLFITHGHNYGVKQNYNRLFLRAEELGVDMVLFGHTHNCLNIEHKGIRIINPGNLYPYDDNRTYCYMLINGKKANAMIIKAQ